MKVHVIKSPKFTEIHLCHTKIIGGTDSKSASSVGSGLMTTTPTTRGTGSCSCLTFTDGADNVISGTPTRQQDVKKQTNPNGGDELEQWIKTNR